MIFWSTRTSPAVLLLRAIIFFGCDLTACYSYCLVPHSLIFPYDDYFRRVAVGNHDALVRHFEAWVASFASPGAGGGVVAADLDPLQKYICRQQ